MLFAFFSISPSILWICKSQAEIWELMLKISLSTLLCFSFKSFRVFKLSSNGSNPSISIFNRANSVVFSAIVSSIFWIAPITSSLEVKILLELSIQISQSGLYLCKSKWAFLSNNELCFISNFSISFLVVLCCSLNVFNLEIPFFISDSFNPFNNPDNWASNGINFSNLSFNSDLVDSCFSKLTANFVLFDSNWVIS